MNRTLSFLALTFPICLFCQQTLDGLDSSSDSNRPDTVLQEAFYVVEQMPEYPGGHEAMFRFIQKNLQYPKEARVKGIEGKVFAEFTVDSLGAIRNIKILRAIGGGCEEETVRVLKLMPDWHPGIQKGKAVNVSFRLPLSFRLPADESEDEE